MTDITVATWNQAYGNSSFNKKYSSNVKKFFSRNSNSIDIIFAQEVRAAPKKISTPAQPNQVLASELKNNGFVNTTVSLKNEIGFFQTGKEAQMISSRLFKLSDADERMIFKEKNWERKLTYCLTSINGKNISLFVYHGPNSIDIPLAAGRVSCAEIVEEEVCTQTFKFKSNFIISGDFNLSSLEYNPFEKTRFRSSINKITDGYDWIISDLPLSPPDNKTILHPAGDISDHAVFSATFSV